MRPTISQLRGWDVANLDAAAKAIEDASKNLDLSIDGVVRDLDSAESFWKGKSFAAAYDQASSEQSSTNRLSFAIGNVAEAVRGGHSALTAARDKVMALVDEANAKGLQVADDGTVTAPQGNRDLQAEARRLTDAIRQALKSLEEADRASSNDLRKASETVDAEHKAASTQPAAFVPASSGGAASGSMRAGSSGFGGGSGSGGGGFSGGHGGGSGGGGGHSVPDGSYSNTGAPSLRPSGPSVFMNLDAGQMDVARKIIEEGLRRGLSPEAIQIALATALTESGLRSLANSSVPDSMMLANDGVGHDHDSVGPFQQRQSWGATADLMDPTRSAGKFYDQLVKVSGWQDMSVAQAAQSVQRSAFPDAYAKYEAQAAQIFHQVTGR